MMLKKKLSLLLTVGFLMSSDCYPLTLGNASDPPNIVIIYTDDQGYGDASCYNKQSKVQTPNIDFLASSGLSFTDAHSADSVCTPSRYALLTGRYCWRTGLKKGVLGAEHQCLIRDGDPTIASFLKSHGYKTWMVGKWHLGMDFPGSSHANRDWSKPILDMPLDKGFDSFFGIPASLNYGVLAWIEGRTAKVPPTLFTAKKPNNRHVDYRIRPKYHETYAAAKKALGGTVIEVAPDFIDNQCLTRFTDRAIEVVRSHMSGPDSASPFFLYLPLTSPHYPVCPLPEFHGSGEAGGYGEFLTETDHHVGRIMQALRASGADQNTLVIFTSDNGPENSWKQRSKEFGHKSNGPLREGKRSVYEGGHRVPFICRWPAGITAPGRGVAHPICQSDVFATIARILDDSQLDLPDSESFLGAFENQTCSRTSPIVHHAANGRFAIRSGQWKLVMSHRNSQTELYNLEKDLAETNNIADQHPDVLTRMTAKFKGVILKGRSNAGEPLELETPYWHDLTWLTEDEYADAAKSSGTAE